MYADQPCILFICSAMSAARLGRPFAAHLHIQVASRRRRCTLPLLLALPQGMAAAHSNLLFPTFVFFRADRGYLSSGRRSAECGTAGAAPGGAPMTAAFTGALQRAPGARCSRGQQQGSRLRSRAATHHRCRPERQPPRTHSSSGVQLEPDGDAAMAAAAGQGPAAPAAAAPPAAAPLQANDAVQPLSQQQRLAEVLRFCLPVVLVPLVSCWGHWAWTGLATVMAAVLCFPTRARLDSAPASLFPTFTHVCRRILL